jgi:hypothetical protein
MHDFHKALTCTATNAVLIASGLPKSTLNADKLDTISAASIALTDIETKPGFDWDAQLMEKGIICDQIRSRLDSPPAWSVFLGGMLTWPEPEAPTSLHNGL